MDLSEKLQRPKKYVAWTWKWAFLGVLMGVIGGLLGQVIPFDLTGIDFAMTALFTVIVVEQAMDAHAAVKNGSMSKGEAVLPVALGFCATLVCLLLMGTSSFLLGAMLLMLVCFFLRYQAEERRRTA